MTKSPMKTFQARIFRSAFIVLFTLVAINAAWAVPGSNAIQSATGMSSQTISPQTQGTFDSTTPAMLESGRRTAAASLPPLAMVAPTSKLSVVFPIFGLVAAVTVTQLLRRRRIARLRSSASTGQ